MEWIVNCPIFQIPVSCVSFVSTFGENIVSYPSYITTNVESKPVSSTRIIHGRALLLRPRPSTRVDFFGTKTARTLTGATGYSHVMDKNC